MCVWRVGVCVCVCVCVCVFSSSIALYPFLLSVCVCVFFSSIVLYPSSNDDLFVIMHAGGEGAFCGQLADDQRNHACPHPPLLVSNMRQSMHAQPRMQAGFID